MTIEELKKAFEQQRVCEFYASGKGWVAWLDEGWHRGIIVAIDDNFPSAILHISKIYTKVYTIVVEVRGEKDMRNLLRLYP